MNGHGQAGADPVEPAALPALSAVLPPLILGTATFNTQYVHDPAKLPARDIVKRAFELGIRAFDTSPYYGPAEILLGESIAAAVQGGHGGTNDTSSTNDSSNHPKDQQHQKSPPPPPTHPRESYLLISKAGRVGPASFDYRPASITASVHRSLERLRTPYLDLVYLHDVEFVTDRDVLGAMPALWDLQRHGKIRYVGISGYPLPRLLHLADQITALGTSASNSSSSSSSPPPPSPPRRPLDAVLSYGNCTVQNTALTDPHTLTRFRAAGVDVVLNASILAMGLLTPSISVGPQGSWHPAPAGLRAACVDMRAAAALGKDDGGKSLVRVAIRFALETWGRAAVAAGLAVGGGKKGALPQSGDNRVGATVIGVTNVEELEETWEEWRGAIRDLGLDLGLETKESLVNGNHKSANTSALVNGRSCSGAARISDSRLEAAASSDVAEFVRQVLWPVLGEWKDHSWESPPQGWFDKRADARDE